MNAPAQKRPPLRRLGERVQRADLSRGSKLESMKFGDERRGSRQSRGYGADWDRLRPQILKRDGYVCQCEDCKAEGIVRTATHVDHKVPKAQGGTDDPSNLQSMNVKCHMRKTAREHMAGRGVGRQGGGSRT